ncbi:MAG: gliding motility-associated C-terminal domain-containing protein [Bacteroidetes bacterium]|nr:gliding motility-associated C-terminal domain-containing protein [Bacteroidota bacterium]
MLRIPGLQLAAVLFFVLQGIIHPLQAEDAPPICTNCTLTPATATICQSGSQVITLGNTPGPPATATGWIYSTTTDDLDQYTAAPGSTASNTYTVTGLAPGTYYFRALVNGGADTTNVSTTITIDANVAGGTLSSGGTHCTTTPGGQVIALAGHTGPIIRWESQTGMGAWTPIAATAGLTVYTVPAGLTDTTRYRVYIENGTCNAYSAISVVAVNPDVDGGILAGGATENCATSGIFTLTLSGQVGMVVRWERKAPAAGSWSNLGNAGNSTLNVTPALTDSFQYRVLVLQPSCGLAYSGIRQINVTPNATVGTAQTDATICSGQSTVVFVDTYAGNIQWEQRVPPGVTFNNVTGPGANGQVLATGALTQTTIYRAVVSRGGCSVNSNEVTITVAPAPVAGTVATPSAICSGTSTTLTLAGSSGNIQWEQSNDGSSGWGNATGGSGATTTSYTSPNLTADRYYRARVSTACQTLYSNVVRVQVGASTTTPNFPAPAAICSGQSTALLGATLPAGTVGVWSCTSCSGGFTSTTDPNARYVSAGNEVSTVVLTWTVSSTGCTDDVNTRNLTVQQGPVGSFSNTPPATCVGDATPSLGAIATTGTGTWSVIPVGAGTFSAPNDGNATFTPNASAGGTTITLRWTILAGGCPNAVYNQSLLVTTNPVGSIVNASLPDRCVGDATPPLQATISNGTSGFWTSSGSGTFLPNSTSLNVTYTPGAGDGGRIITLTWNVVNGSCPPAAYSRDLTVVNSPIASVPSAPLDTICAGASTIPLGASASNGTGSWSCSAYWSAFGTFYSCSGYFDPSPTDANARYVSSSADWDFDMTLTWSVANGVCPDATADRDFYILNQYITGTFDPPSPSSVCKGSRLGPLNASSGLGTIGTWSCIGCEVGVHFRDGLGNPAPNSPNAYYHALPGDAATVTLVWTISNNNCAAPRVLQQNIHTEEAPTGTIPVGLPPICAGDPVRVFATSTSGLGNWSTSSGNGSFVNVNDLLTFFTPSALDGNDGGTSLADLVWTATKPGCPPSSTSSPLFIYHPSEGGINNVPDSICVEETAQLDAYLTWGTGLWLTDGNGGFTNSISPTARYIPLLADTGHKVEVVWVVTNGNCNSQMYRDSIYVRRQSKGSFNTIIPAVCEGQTTIPLNGGLINGTGTWSTNGNGFFSDPHDPQATYAAGAGDGAISPITITWTVQNHTCLEASYSQILNVFRPSFGGFDVAPAPICFGGQTEPLQAFRQFGWGRWYTPDGSGTFSNPIEANARYISGPTDQDQTVTLIWRVGNGTCDSIDYMQTVFVNNIVADAGSDVTICVNGSTTLQATGGTEYLWLPATGLSDNTIANPIASPTGNTTYTVSVGDGSGCFFTDEVTVFVSNNGSVIASSSDNTVCVDSTVVLSLTGTNLNVSTIQWTPAAPILAAGGDPTAASTVAMLPSATTFTVTVETNTGCVVESPVFVNIYPVNRPSIVARDNCINEKQFLLAQDINDCQEMFWFQGAFADVRAAGPLNASNPNYRSDDILFLAEESAQLGTSTYSLFCKNLFGCGSFDQKSYTIIPGPNGDFSADRRVVVYGDRTINFTSFDLNTPPDVTRHYWDFGDPLSGESNNSTDANPSHSYASFGTYTVALYVSTDLNCSDLIIKTNYITVAPPEYSFPSAFTPNNDGINDFFRPLPADGSARILNFRVYDRWDQLIFETKDPQGWDGRSASGVVLDPGVYTYDVTVDLPELGNKRYTGMVHLLR